MTPTTPRPMDPTVGLVIAANAALTEANFRDSVRQMLDEGYPLVKMVEALGLDDELDKPLRNILDGLKPDVVDGIRQATIAMLDSKNYALPLDCNVTPAEIDEGLAVDVEVVPEDGKLTIRTRLAPGSKK